MTATFVSLDGETYLQDIRDDTLESIPERLHVNFDPLSAPHGLALQVDHLEVRNIAFHFSKSQKPYWLRDEDRLAKVFIDRSNTGASIRILSDVRTLFFC